MESLLLSALRNETAALHDALESAVGLTDPDLSPRQYVATLEDFLQVVEPVEARIACGLPPRLLAYYAPRRKARRLREDLDWLRADGWPPPAGGPVRLRAMLPAIGTPAQAFGALYVLEGAALGGQVVSRHIEQRFGLRAGRGYSYFCADGRQAGAMWRQFRALLDAEVPPAEHRAAVDAAVHTFRAFHQQCARVPVA